MTSLPVSAVRAGAAAQPQWLVTLEARPAAGTQVALALVNQQSAFDATTGTSQTWADGLTTTYSLTNPQPNMLTAVASEAITIAPVDPGR